MTRELRALRFVASLFAMFLLAGWQGSSGQFAPPSNTSQPAAPQDSTGKNSGQSSSSAPNDAPPQPKKPKVITNDDINASRARHNDGFGGGRDLRESAGNGDCDDECADQARELAGFGEDQEGEWRAALTAARRNLATDRAWPGAYATLARAVKTYCTFQQQAQQATVPTGNDYSSRAERARHEKYVQDMTRVLQQNVDNANAQIERMAQQADDNEEPARGAIMRVLAQRANDSCNP